MRPKVWGRASEIERQNRFENCFFKIRDRLFGKFVDREETGNSLEWQLGFLDELAGVANLLGEMESALADSGGDRDGMRSSFIDCLAVLGLPFEMVEIRDAAALELVEILRNRAQALLERGLTCRSDGSFAMRIIDSGLKPSLEGLAKWDLIVDRGVLELVRAIGRVGRQWNDLVAAETFFHSLRHIHRPGGASLFIKGAPTVIAGRVPRYENPLASLQEARRQILQNPAFYQEEPDGIYGSEHALLGLLTPHWNSDPAAAEAEESLLRWALGYFEELELRNAAGMRLWLEEQ